VLSGDAGDIGVGYEPQPYPNWENMTSTERAQAVLQSIMSGLAITNPIGAALAPAVVGISANIGRPTASLTDLALQAAGIGRDIPGQPTRGGTQAPRGVIEQETLPVLTARSVDLPGPPPPAPHSVELPGPPPPAPFAPPSGIGAGAIVSGSGLQADPSKGETPADGGMKSDWGGTGAGSPENAGGTYATAEKGESTGGGDKSDWGGDWGGDKSGYSEWGGDKSDWGGGWGGDYGGWGGGWGGDYGGWGGDDYGGAYGDGGTGEWREGGWLPNDRDGVLSPLVITAHEGEFIVRPEAAAKHGRLLEQINQDIAPDDSLVEDLETYGAYRGGSLSPWVGDEGADPLAEDDPQATGAATMASLPPEMQEAVMQAVVQNPLLGSALAMLLGKQGDGMLRQMARTTRENRTALAMVRSMGGGGMQQLGPAPGQSTPASMPR
jgi:hypothetical protein